VGRRGGISLGELRAAIAAKRDLSRIAPFGHFDIPAEWARTYAATAKGVPAAGSFPAQTAADLVSSFVDPALGERANPAAWGPQALAWIPDTSDPAATATDI
jgi:hypothetical protein